MAQFDFTQLNFFLPIFSFILIFALIYAILDKFKIMGDSKAVKLTISLSIALLFMFSIQAVEFVREIIPWFVILFVVVFLIFALFMFLGVSEETWVNTIKNPGVYWVILSFLIIALLIVIGKVFAPEPTTIDQQQQEEPPANQALSEIFNARVLGALIVLIICLFVVQNLTGD